MPGPITRRIHSSKLRGLPCGAEWSRRGTTCSIVPGGGARGQTESKCCLWRAQLHGRRWRTSPGSRRTPQVYQLQVRNPHTRTCAVVLATFASTTPVRHLICGRGRAGQVKGDGRWAGQEGGGMGGAPAWTQAALNR